MAALLLLLALAATTSQPAAARQLDAVADSSATVQPPRQQHQSYAEALANSSCHSFLIGIGTQKGGTTALWAYIADLPAHPHLRVSKTKELGFWDSLHTRYSGCRVGDYLRLHTTDEPGDKQQQQQQQLPICPAVSTTTSGLRLQLQQAPGAGSNWSSAGSAGRLKPSQDCHAISTLKQAVQTQGAAAAADAHVTLPAAGSSGDASTVKCPAGLYLPGDISPPKPWWWLWARWPASSGAACRQQQRTPDTQQDAAGQATIGSARLLLQQQQEPVPQALAGLSSLSLAVLPSTGPMQVAATAAAPEILGAPSQLRLLPPFEGSPMVHADITPRYMLDPAVPLRVRSLLPEARIVVILRDPVARALSNFNMWWQKQAAKDPASRPQGSWSETLAAQVDAEIARLTACYQAVGTAAILQPELAACLGLGDPFSSPTGYDEALFANRLLAQGLYADQLQRWFELFPAESFVIWVSEDFKADPARHMQHLTRWLGLFDPQLLHPKLRDASSRLKPVHGRHYEGSASAEVVARMRQFFKLHNARLFDLLEAKGFGAVAARMRQAWTPQ